MFSCFSNVAQSISSLRLFSQNTTWKPEDPTKQEKLTRAKLEPVHIYMCWRLADFHSEVNRRQSCAMENFEQSQLPKVKILQSVQKNLACLGIYFSSTNKMQKFNGKVLTDFLMLTTAIGWTLMYIFINAETFTEYNQSIYICTSFVLITSVLAITSLNSTKLYIIINHCEYLINVRKWQTRQIAQKIVFSCLTPLSPNRFST